MKVTAGEFLVRTLMQAQVEQIFALHGAHIEPVFQSCLDHHIGITDVRHEVAAGHAAEAYARAARKLGVALVTAGPGFTNVITSIANAYLDRTPVLYITGSAALRDAESNTLQAGIDQVAVARPITKWAHQITTADQLPRLAAQAVRIATSEPTGPVLLDIPMDVMGALLDEEQVSIPENTLLHAPPAPAPAAVDRAIALLSAAARPVLMLGGGVWQSGGEEVLREFVELTGIPVYSDFAGHGTLPSKHPLYIGTFHKMADLAAADARPDVVLALGVRFGLFTIGGSDMLVPAQARIIHIDTDAKEIGRLRNVEVPVVADSREALRALLTRAQACTWPDLGPWQETLRTIRKNRFNQFKDALARKAPPIHPYQAVATIVDHISDDTIIIGDGAESYHWLNEVIRQNHGGSYLTHSYLGAVGFGLGLSLGAKRAHPDRPVLCIVGDGGVGITIAEFDTMVRNQLPIVVVIINNSSWGASQHFQEIVSGAERVTGTRLGNARYHEVAAGFGCHAQLVTEIDDLGAAIENAYASGKPACINVAVDLQPVPPEVGMLMGGRS